MRLVGLCSGCGKIRSVRVNARELAQVAAGGHIAQGICSGCERDEEEQRVTRANERLRR